ncbi:MAG: hypothetical protein ACON4O_01445 [Lentimonas sp.]
MHRLFTTSFTKLAGFLLCGVLLAGSGVSANIPAFVKESLHTPYAAKVASVESTLAADIVIIDGGLDQGLRLGMVCTVSRGPKSVGELIIIESQSDRAAGLILELVDESIIQAGDIARVKTLQNS